MQFIFVKIKVRHNNKWYFLVHGVYVITVVFNKINCFRGGLLCDLCCRINAATCSHFITHLHVLIAMLSLICAFIAARVCLLPRLHVLYPLVGVFTLR